jgi:hypothetical protein
MFLLGVKPMLLPLVLQAQPMDVAIVFIVLKWVRLTIKLFAKMGCKCVGASCASPSKILVSESLVLDFLRRLDFRKYVCIFALETSNPLAHRSELLRWYTCPLVVLNCSESAPG